MLLGFVRPWYSFVSKFQIRNDTIKFYGIISWSNMHLFKILLIINLTCIWWLINWGEKIENVMPPGFMTTQHSFISCFHIRNDTIKYYVAISWSIRYIFEIFFIINFTKIYQWINWANKIGKIIWFSFLML